MALWMALKTVGISKPARMAKTVKTPMTSNNEKPSACLTVRHDRPMRLRIDLKRYARSVPRHPEFR